MDRIMVYLAIVIKNSILKDNYYYVDNFYEAIREIAGDYLKSDEYTEDDSVYGSVYCYVKNNRRLVIYIMNKEKVTDEKII